MTLFWIGMGLGFFIGSVTTLGVARWAINEDSKPKETLDRVDSE